MKATSVVVHGERREIFKAPITDDGVKKSAKGLIKVDVIDNEYVLADQATPEQENEGALHVIYENGLFVNPSSLQEIRDRINEIL
jgi:nicotinamide phosphoribosyltransferase